MHIYSILWSNPRYIQPPVACFDERWASICTVLIIFIVFESSPSSKNVGVIVGAVLGGGGGLLLVVVVGIYVYKKHKN